ncbi:hypothetical protein JOC86_002237 [Bacillus pakistanensis]|uniref:DUF4129 domain-containing protein n=1 Tax=Rossellomorea pakistanensis TaxID=992288 RepID=A0ABS2NCV8_9BACI|nr:DUF4129 domain-containing protein [Bacillus pakistanensis]MBM7585695.1 hypothetical protein [Bacillus pakistanensis]
MLDSDKARDDLEDILNNREYTVYNDRSSGILSSWWEKITSWIEDQLSDWFPALEATSGVASVVTISLIVLAIMLLLLCLFYVARGVRRNLKYKDKKPLQSLNEIHWSSSKHLSEADKQSAFGQYSLSTRHLFLALLLHFHEKEWLEAKIWKTNWDYYDELRRVNKVSAVQFFELALLFDEVTYGEKKLEKEEYLQYRKKVMMWLKEDHQDQLNVI